MDTIYGTFPIEEPIIMELLNSAAMQRLKGIHQGGVVSYAIDTQEYSRFDHCVGVYVLLSLYGLSLEERVAGLLHDVSHTVFSHVGDLVFNHNSSSHSYQDEIHPWYLEESGIEEILHKYGLTVEQVDPKRKDFRALESSLPLMCADRIDYNLQCGISRGLLTSEQLHALVGDLRFNGETWYFESAEAARRFGEISLEMTEQLWGAPWGLLINVWMAEALQRALDIQLLTEHDLHFSIDEEVWQRMISSNDEIIKKQIVRIMSIKEQYAPCEYGQEDLLLKGKFRGIDPLVNTKQGLRSLSKLDGGYADKYQRLKETMTRGWPVKLDAEARSVKDRFLEI